MTGAKTTGTEFMAEYRPEDGQRLVNMVGVGVEMHGVKASVVHNCLEGRDLKGIEVIFHDGGCRSEQGLGVSFTASSTDEDGERVPPLHGVGF